MSSWLIQTAVLPGIVSALEVRPSGENPTVNTDSWAPAQDITATAIQQASWSDVLPLQKIDEHAKVAVVTRPGSSKVRDDAPPSLMVISALIGVAVFSLILCLMTLPHHWFYGNTTRWKRTRW